MPISIASSIGSYIDRKLGRIKPEVTQAVNEIYQDPTNVSESDKEIAKKIKLKIDEINDKEKKLTEIKKLLPLIQKIGIEKIFGNQNDFDQEKLDKITDNLQALRDLIFTVLNITEKDEIFKNLTTLQDALSIREKDQIHAALGSLSNTKQKIREKITECEQTIEDKRKGLPALARELSQDGIKEKKLAQLIKGNTLVPEKDLRRQFNIACASKRNQVIIEANAKQEAERVITSYAGGTQSSSSSNNQPAELPVAAAKQPQEVVPTKRSWIRSCLDSISKFFTPKPAKTDLSIFSSLTGKAFLSQIDSHTNPPDIEGQKKRELFFFNFTRKFNTLIEGSTIFPNSSTSLNEEIQQVIEKTAELFQEHYKEKYEAQKKKYTEELNVLKTKIAENEQEKKRINAQKFALRKLVKFYDSGCSDIDRVHKELLADYNLRLAALDLIVEKKKMAGTSLPEEKIQTARNAIEYAQWDAKFKEGQEKAKDEGLALANYFSKRGRTQPVNPFENPQRKILQ